eukprot:CAMPEP_0201545786 /NCGR_PEP_ID=MMETSP0173_2-20130828/2214_1 /ASSEMBLY_ACC=CAM_ASM_000268 /TAXON_ID=218659 /ORGANISM="Vexillifera sp., Strain DIVA3 564/2" /LENGTH=275 /DNA_ID=CAMNT_0047954285 /DNA_START=61 /DNA_END=888 /DNA_ORIENTATION=-
MNSFSPTLLQCEEKLEQIYKLLISQYSEKENAQSLFYRLNSIRAQLPFLLNEYCRVVEAKNKFAQRAFQSLSQNQLSLQKLQTHATDTTIFQTHLQQQQDASLQQLGLCVDQCHQQTEFFQREIVKSTKSTTTLPQKELEVQTPDPQIHQKLQTPPPQTPPPPKRRQTQTPPNRSPSTLFEPIGASEFDNLSSIVRGRAKLEAVNKVYKVIWQHFTTKQKRRSLKPISIKTLSSKGLKVTGQTGSAVLNTLRALHKIDMSREGVTLVGVQLERRR